jgi:hypothetical protein
MSYNTTDSLIKQLFYKPKIFFMSETPQMPTKTETKGMIPGPVQEALKTENIAKVLSDSLSFLRKGIKGMLKKAKDFLD